METSRKHKVLANSCDYGKSISEFFTESCAPGAEDAAHMRTAGTNVQKVCSLCNGMWKLINILFISKQAILVLCHKNTCIIANREVNI